MPGKDRILQKLLMVGIGGFFGSVLRYWLGGLVMDRSDTVFPLGTLVVNISGSLLMGLLFAVALERFAIGEGSRIFLAVGFLGAYTTFSTLMLESYTMMESGEFLLAGLDMAGSIILGFMAFYIGLIIGRLI